MLETLRVHCLSEQASCMDSGNSKNKREHNHSEKESKHNIILLPVVPRKAVAEVSRRGKL